MNQQRQMTQLMLIGLASGLILQAQLQAESTTDKNNKQKESRSDFLQKVKSTGGNVSYEAMTEDDLLLQLNEETTKIYHSLSPEGKKLALETASRKCNGTNSCAGLNACRTDENECAGKGSCRGKTKCSISDPNLAVKMVAEKMAKKRAEAQGR